MEGRGSARWGDAGRVGNTGAEREQCGIWNCCMYTCDEAAKTQIRDHTAITVSANRCVLVSHCVPSAPTSKGQRSSVCSKGPDASAELHRSSQKAVSKASQDAQSKGFACVRCDNFRDQIPPSDSLGVP